MDSDRNTEDILPYLEKLKISAFKKVDLIRNQVQNVTIGPSATIPRTDITQAKNVLPAQDTKVEAEVKIKRSPDETQTQIKGAEENNSLIPFRQVLKEYEYLRQRKVQEAMQSHSKKFELFSAQQSMNRKQSWLLQQQKLEQNKHLYEEEVITALKKYDEEKLNEQKIIKQHQQKLESEKKKIAAAIEAKKKENEMLNHCLDNQSKFQSAFQDIMMNIKNCQDNALKAELAESWKHCKELSDLMEGLMQKCKTKVSEQEKDMIEMVLKRMYELQLKINQMIKGYNEKKAKDEAEVSYSLKSDIPEKTVTDVHSMSVPKEQKEQSVSPLTEYIGKSQLEVYTAIMEFHQKYVNSFKDFLNLEEFKQFRFDCKKAVNLSVNTISAVSSQHLHDKYVKLSNLLSGKNTVIGDFQIIASKHPKGISYCIDLLAKKFVLQGDLMVSCNPESAFAFATIIISIWNESPDFGKILLAYFFKDCVYLIPFYPPRIINQTDQEYYKSQGYRYTDDKVEEQDKFLKRMAGTMRLYFAILISNPKRSQSRHPYSINHAWTWFISVLKLKPRLDITATMLHTFFDTIGFEMQKVYGKQFSKVMKYFIEEFFPLMKKIDSGGPVTRLDCLMQEFKENGNKFLVPKGLLSENFW
ncbi:nucleoporin Gle1 [Coccinella septempunctata]|uniref:nucleoporin Gle1 n=1 Tax=Coccinella septempunctata TaxID=41139 RepID=UPI001D061640|nr:nucleoporin Gle1 [Coccinella septempunctata]